ncbi:unnamed protein product [Urochloa humidicola]
MKVRVASIVAGDADPGGADPRDADPRAATVGPGMGQDAVQGLLAQAKDKDKVDDFAAKAHAELCKQYKVLDAKVLSKIPRAPPKDKKEN